MYAFHLGRELARTGYDVAFVIPNYQKAVTEEYSYESFRVIKYAEPSLVDRDLKMGKRPPEGLSHFREVLPVEKPDVVHFHEIAGSNGITFGHVHAAKEQEYKVVTTLHVSRYTAAVDNGDVTDDIFNIKQASQHVYKKKGLGSASVFVHHFATALSNTGIDLTSLGTIGTALSVPRLMEEKRDQFLQLVENSDKVVTVARWYYDVLVTNGIDINKLHFIEQGVEEWYAKSDEPRHESSPVKIIFIGRISAIKGVKLLMEAVKEIDDENFLLDIYGDSGEDEQYIGECKVISECCRTLAFKGRLNPDKKYEVMRSYDLLALPSSVQEMSPLVIREAFAAGIPVLASDSMGAKEQIQDGKNGWLFRMNDKKDLKEKLKMLISHPEKLIEAKNYMPPLRTFTDVAREYKKLYEDIA